LSTHSSPHNLRRLLGALSVIAILVVALALGVGALSFSLLLDARRAMIDEIDPAATAARDLFAALVSQETGVRGFLLTGEEAFLEPYERGQVDERDARERLIRDLRNHPRLHHAVAEVDRRAAQWREAYAEAAIDGVRGGTPSTPAGLAIGKQRFDAIRSAFAELETGLRETRAAALDDLDQSTVRLAAALVAMFACLAGVGIAVRMAFTRGVLRPLTTLGAGARRVTAGDIGHPLAIDGPSEIADLAADVEAMRSRIVSALAHAEQSRAVADERARDLARSNAELEQFAYVASHDLQEPLRKVASFCQMLQQRYAGQLDERADQYIAFAVDGAKRMQRLINDLLALSRVGRSTDRFVPVDCDVALEHALANLESLSEESGGQIDAEPLPTVWGDLALLTTLFQNLVGNSLKFRGETPPKVRVWAEPNGDYWRFSVADNGIGIDPRHAERVFVIFQRLHASEEYGGTGIGLALCKKIVEYHYGRIWIDTEAHPGTTVHWTLPRSKETAHDLADAGPADRHSAGRG